MGLPRVVQYKPPDQLDGLEAVALELVIPERAVLENQKGQF